MQKNIVILGATGFIGRNMALHFAAQKDVRVTGTYFRSAPLEHPHIRMVQADLTRRDDVDRVIEGSDLVIQAAAVTSGAQDIVHNPHVHIADNAVMNSHIFRAAFDHQVAHVIFFSCTVMYHSSSVALKEEDFDPGREMHPNYFGGGWNKVYFEKMCEFYARQGRNKYTVIRHSNIYGPHDKFDLEKSHVFGATMTKVITTPDGGAISVWGAGEEKRDLLFIEDLMEFVQLAGTKQKSPFDLFNVGSGNAVSVKDLVRLMVRCSGKQLEIKHDLSKPSINTSLCLNCSKAQKELGWRPRTSLEEGILKTMTWYRAHFK